MNPIKYTRNSSSSSVTSSSLKLPLDHGFRKMAEPDSLSQPWICTSPSQPEPWFCAQVLLAKDDIWLRWKVVGPWKAVGSGRIRKVKKKKKRKTGGNGGGGVMKTRKVQRKRTRNLNNKNA